MYTQLSHRTMNKHTLFFASMFFLVVALGSFVYWQERIVSGGEEVILATVPIDPRDFLRGEYVILRYEIETASVVQADVSRTELTRYGYIRLEVDERGVARAVAFRRQTPDFTTGIWLRGEMDGNRIRFPDLEQYFVPEGAGTPLERMQGDLFVRVRVREGEARVTGLLDENLQPIDPYDYRTE